MMKKRITVLLFSCLFALIGYQSFANEWVDMGPLHGSTEGHIWSKVVDEVGNTQGRNEIWQLSLPCPVIAEVIVKCPDAYQLEVAVDYTHALHGIIQFKPKRIDTGFYTKEISFKNPELIKNLRISVYSRKPSTDQRYQLTVNLKTLDGKPVTAAASTSSSHTESAGSDAEKFSGKWVSTDNGSTYIMIMTWNGREYDITWQENEAGAITSRGKGIVENGNLKIDWRPGSARIGTMTVSGSGSGKYRSTTLTGAEPFESTFNRQKPGNSSAKTVTSTVKTPSNLALGKPATQSSTYAGTGVDHGPQHAVDGKTGGRDPHGLIHTNYEKNPWWRVDLGTKAAIEKIKIYNRTNPGVKSNLSLELLVSDDGQNWQSVYTHDNEVFQMLAVPLNATGRHVMARLNAERDALQLYEIEVIGSPLP